MRTLIVILLLSLALVCMLGTSVWSTAKSLDELEASQAENNHHQLLLTKANQRLESANSTIEKLSIDLAYYEDKLVNASNSIAALESEIDKLDEPVDYYKAKSKVREFSSGEEFRNKMNEYMGVRSVGC